MKAVYLIGLLTVFSHAQLRTFTFEEAENRMEVESRPMIVFFHAEWCRVCRMMEESTFRDARVVNRLNEKFYFVSFAAEETNDIRFQGKVYRYRPSGVNSGMHELAETFLGNEIVYPTVVIIDGQNIHRVHSFLSADEMLRLLEIVRK